VLGKLYLLSTDTRFLQNPTLLTNFSSEISWEGRKKFLAPYSSPWKLEIWGHFLVKKGISNFLRIFVYFMNKNDKDKPEKWETSFFIIDQKSKIGNKFRPPKSSMGTLFLPGSSKNRSFFTFECRIPPIWVPQQHHLARQQYGGHVA